jgi:hypothetical protein
VHNTSLGLLGSESYIPTLKKHQELWDRFTCKEEYDPPFLDKYGRFPDYLSKNRDFFDPSVSRYLIEHDLIHPQWPDDKDFAVCLTHDIDAIYPYQNLGVLSGAAQLLMQRKVQDSANMLFSHVNKKRSPWYNIKEIIKLEKSYDATSSFYFLAVEKDDIDFNYDVNDIADIAGTIIDEGFEVGLHGSRQAYNDANRMKLEKQRLEQVLGTDVVGYRNHYLCFKTPDTWHHLKNAGFLYDTTFGFDGVIGFRNGMCHPFQPFDLKNNKIIDGLWEIPLTIMDCTLLGEYYMRLGPDQAWLQSKKMIDTVAELGGVVTILWHNTYMDKKNQSFYSALIKYCLEKNAWLTTCKEIKMD